MATLKTGTKINNQTAWHAGNDGSGSGLDADMVDGVHASGLGTAQVSATAPTPRAVGDLWNVTGSSGHITTFDASWITATLVSPWVNYGNGYEPARFRKLINGMVQMAGLVRGGAAGSVIFTLPVGYRPQYSQLMSTSNNDCNVCRLDIYHDTGNVYAYPTIGDVTGWVSLNLMFWVG